jgi:hypothetical protein
MDSLAKRNPDARPIDAHRRPSNIKSCIACRASRLMDRLAEAD